MADSFHREKIGRDSERTPSGWVLIINHIVGSFLRAKSSRAASAGALRFPFQPRERCNGVGGPTGTSGKSKRVWPVINLTSTDVKYDFRRSTPQASPSPRPTSEQQHTLLASLSPASRRMFLGMRGITLFRWNM